MKKTLLVALLGLFLISCNPSFKDLYVQLSYPKLTPEQTQQVPRDWELTFTAQLMPVLLPAYSEPRKAGRCLDRLSKLKSLPREFWLFGRCLQLSSVSPPGGALFGNRHFSPYYSRWAVCLSELSTLFRARNSRNNLPSYTSPLLEGKLCPGFPRGDVKKLLLSLASAAEESFLFYFQTQLKNSIFWLHPPSEYSKGLRSALGAASKVLLYSPQNFSHSPRPVLALSGGAANGAFTAGFLHALLSLRQFFSSDIRRRLDKKLPPAQAEFLRKKLKTAQNYRFAGAVGTSVGALLAAILDFYFSSPPPSNLREYLRKCPVSGNFTSIEECALAFLERQFTKVNEWDLLCVEDKKFSDLFVGNQKNMLRFTPFVNNILRPFLSNFSDLMLGNNFISKFVSADLKNNLVVGVDERACQILPGIQTKCLERAILASISEPTFVPAVEELYFGGKGWTRGLWYDGGIRSGSPAVLAALLADSKVLVLNTSRVNGVLGRRFKNGFSVLFGSLSDLVEVVRDWEIAYASLLYQHRQTLYSVLDFALESSSSSLRGGAGIGSTSAPRGGSKKVGKPDSSVSSLSGGSGSAGGTKAALSGGNGSAGGTKAASGGNRVISKGDSGVVGRGGQSKGSGTSEGRGAKLSALQVNKGVSALRAMPALGGNIWAVYVPDGVPRPLIAQGYAFDPYIMKGLFVWGQYRFIQRAVEIVRWLGWFELISFAGYSPRWKRYVRQVESAIREYSPEKVSKYIGGHFERRRRLVKRELKVCGR